MKMVYDYFTRTKLTDIYQNTVGQTKGDNNSEWGYIPTHAERMIPVLELMKHYGLTKMLDLGAGPGFFLYGIRRFLSYYGTYLNTKKTYDVVLDGVDNEQVFIEDASKGLLNAINSRPPYRFNLKHLNLLQIKQEDVKGYNVLFMYEPITKTEVSKLFIDELAKAAIKGQYIIYNSAGAIGGHMGRYPNKFELVTQHRGIYLYRVL